VSRLDVVLTGLSLFAVAVILVAEARRGRGTPSATLPGRMLVVLRISLGIFFFILGIIGLLLPVVPQTIFFLLSVLILFPQSRLAIKALDYIQPRAPRLVQWLHRIGVGVHR
jgi:hypothetical protein